MPYRQSFTSFQRPGPPTSLQKPRHSDLFAKSRTTFQMPIRDSCAHFGPKRVPSERRTDMAARPLERKTTAMALREGKGRAMSDNI